MFPVATSESRRAGARDGAALPEVLVLRDDHEVVAVRQAPGLAVGRAARARQVEGMDRLMASPVLQHREQVLVLQVREVSDNLLGAQLRGEHLQEGG